MFFFYLKALLFVHVTSNLILNVPSQMTSSYTFENEFDNTTGTSNWSNNGAYYDNRMSHTNTPLASPFDWLDFTLLTATLIRSFLIFAREDCCLERNNFQFRVGNFTTPYNN